jgi:hypothetical protein
MTVMNLTCFHKMFVFYKNCQSFHNLESHFTFLLLVFHKFLWTNQQCVLKINSRVYGSFIDPINDEYIQGQALQNLDYLTMKNMAFQSFKLSELNTQWHKVTSQKTWIFSNTTVRTLSPIFLVAWHTYPCRQLHQVLLLPHLPEVTTV